MFNWWLLFWWAISVVAFLSYLLLSYAFRDFSFLLLAQSSFTFLGLIASARQMYLQNIVTDQALSCGPKFVDLFVSLPFTEFVSRIFQADSGCSQPTYMIIGFQISEWSSAIFLFFIFLILFKFFYQFMN